MSGFNRQEAERLISELREFDSCMTHAPWRSTMSLRLANVITDAITVCRVNLLDDDATDREHIDAAGIARLRNNAAPLADQIEAALAEIDRLDQQRTSAGEALVVVTAERDRLREQALSLDDGSELRRVRSIIQRLNHRERGEWGDPLDGCIAALDKAIDGAVKS